MRNLQHTLSWLLLIICGFFFALTTMGAAASGDNCGQPLPHEAHAMADVVVQGKVLGVEFKKPSVDAKNQYAIITIKVTHALKGKTGEVVRITTASPNQYGWFPFRKGEEYIVFGNTLHNGSIYSSRYMGNMFVKDELAGIELRQRVFEPGRFEKHLDISVYQLQPVNHKLGVGIRKSPKEGSSS